jgi:CxxC motif-containing protein (DUF1111 family)
MSTRVAAMVAAGVVAAIAVASAVAVAGRIDRIDRSSEAADFLAGVALFASAILVGVVALTRTRLAAQEAEIERLRARVIDAELRTERCASDEEWSECMADTAAEGSVLRISER